MTGVDPNGGDNIDLMSNLREYLSGTNPTNAASVCKRLGAARTNDTVLVNWTTVGGYSYVFGLLQKESAQSNFPG